MSKGGRTAVVAVAAAVVLFWLFGFWPAVAVLIGVPVLAYLLLDSSQRRRVRGMSRKRLGR
ncbi:hypothetical protein WDV06_26025 [Streptomyces racemochromogenes]|uniref:Integral membrane protein n=1 Tax=Streptomyces racemochromogenes TaxID=67353 RepID=A0ABW7PJD6_9ACTN